MQQLETVTVGNLTILTIAGIALTFLIKYFIASKDKNTEVIMKDIKEMKEMFYKLSTDHSLLGNHITYSKSSLDSLISEVTKLRDIQSAQSRVIERLTTSKSITEKQISDLEKKYNELKRIK